MCSRIHTAGVDVIIFGIVTHLVVWQVEVGLVEVEEDRREGNVLKILMPEEACRMELGRHIERRVDTLRMVEARSKASAC